MHVKEGPYKGLPYLMPKDVALKVRAARKERPLLYWLQFQIWDWTGDNFLSRAVARRLLKPKTPFWANKKNFFLSALAAAVWIYAALGFVR